jgi:hypothetical protein
MRSRVQVLVWLTVGSLKLNSELLSSNFIRTRFQETQWQN